MSATYHGDDPPPPGDTDAIAAGVLENDPKKRIVRARPNVDFQNDLVYTEKGFVKAASCNLDTILSQAPAWRGVLAWNEHSHRPEYAKAPPWPTADRSVDTHGIWGEREDHLLLLHLEREYLFSLSPGAIRACVENVARRNPYHPVVRHLEGPTWDETPRLDTWLSVYLGANSQPSEYLTSVGRWILISAVARAFKPGCKVDTIAILEGGQGEGKSTAVGVLGDAWFVEIDAATLGGTDKDTLMVLRQSWITEAAEFDSLGGQCSRRLKATASRQVDTYRAPYGKDPVSIPRGFIIIGTTNAHEYLRDETGARRFWPVRTGRIDIEALRRDRDQLFAEALVRFKADGRWWPEKGDDACLAEQQEERRQADTWEETIAEYLRDPRRRAEGVTTTDILGNGCLRIETGNLIAVHQMRVAAVLRALGWHKERVMVNGERTYRHYPKVEPQLEKDDPCA